MNNISKVLKIWMLIACCIESPTYGFALAPATVAGIASSAGRISNTIKNTKAWQQFASNSNAIVRQLPAKAMDVVQDVVGSLLQEGRIIILSPNGGLRGRIQTFRTGNPGYYYSFRGIRYGQAPIGQRRFRSALPENPWNGTRNAIREGSPCPHRNVLLDTYKGNEDCLFLNVYTKRLPNKDSHPRLPVMVFIHGGAFSSGSGNSFLYGPDFLVAEDVVLVTINYRLGPLGFLSLGSDAPGNAGLKDQILALKWVQENIAAFGGDPSEVTIFGESAGAASVHYLILSPQSDGLFHRAISESGSALNPWALAENPTERSFRLGKVLGFETNNTEHLLAFLRKIPSRKLIDYAPLTITKEDAKNNIGLPFVPSIEQYPTDNPIITEHPLKLMKRGAFIKVPYITGFNANEAMLFIRRLKKNPELLQSYDAHFDRLLPNDLDMPGGRESSEAKMLTQKIRQFYLGNSSVSEKTIDEMINLLTDIMFVRGIITTARLHSFHSNVTTYVYRFGFDGALGLFKRLMGISRRGVCHGDEMGYLFHFGFFNLSLNPDAPEIQVKNQMVALWTNFAKYGNPTPLGPNDPILTNEWNPVKCTSTSKSIPYMAIDSSLDMKTDPDVDRLQLWDEIYEKYNGKMF